MPLSARSHEKRSFESALGILSLLIFIAGFVSGFLLAVILL